jgi:hypothetical protein
MKTILFPRPVILAALAAFLFGNLPLLCEEDKGESKAEKALKNRATAPKADQIDPNATIAALLEKQGPADWSNTKGAHLEGYVVQVETEEDGDVHLVLAAAPREPNTQKWVITEVPPAWQKKTGHSAKSLKSLMGTQVRVEGWLYREPDDEHVDPRGTPWEVHPVTRVEKVE